MTHRQPLRTFQVLVLAHHPPVRALLAQAGGTPCHLVGGALRDRLLGLPLSARQEMRREAWSGKAVEADCPVRDSASTHIRRSAKIHLAGFDIGRTAAWPRAS